MGNLLKLITCLCLLSTQVMAQKNGLQKAEIVEGIFLPSEAQSQQLKEINVKASSQLRQLDSMQASGISGKERIDKVKAIRGHRDSALLKVLGKDDFVLYKKQTTFSSRISDSVSNSQKQRLLAMNAKLNLNAEEVDSLKILLTNYEGAKKRIFNIPDISTEDKKKKILELKEAHLQNVKALMKDVRFKKFKEEEGSNTTGN